MRSWSASIPDTKRAGGSPHGGPPAARVVHAAGFLGVIMGLINEYRAAVVAMYPTLVLRDPYCDADDEDHGQARREALDAVVAANRYQAFVHVAQTVVPVAIRIQLWDQAPPTEPGDQWDGHDHVALHCPTGRLLVETPPPVRSRCTQDQ